ncbi:uncharacterized protein I303_101256 [Kwoniella dejecticola CBS 10117]|uniref:Uncharacterized protein n=1 Tax=Kwoniella dejecticola CBS 10117 TaxID=1296121 RepID=A0A1A6AHA0_9TREE|nr:uncharacterized protein I303_01263 [Kwoniella dejecticola CBS 10117]OBR89436.1 hypothetical protein I303_01263 [Kwoniella dejecticola CBS 10117]
MVRFASAACLIAPAFLGSVSALSSFEYLQVTKNFADAFMPSTSTDLVTAINSKKALFAEDVQGTVDIAGTIDGRDYSTDFLFGLFLGAAQNPNVPSPIGIPISYNVTSAAVEHNTVSAGIKFELEYPVLNTTYPIELEAFLTINEQKEITQYDLIFRRWAWATDTIVPQLTPYMAHLLGMSNDNSTLTLQRFLAFASCTVTMTYCDGTNAQYDSLAQCVAGTTALPTGQFYRVGENNLACRAVHASMLQLNPEAYCPAMSASGGDFCIDRDYADTVREDHFTQGFLAPKYVTPENKKIVQNVWASSSEKELSPLLEISMSNQDMHSWDATFYATMTFVYFIFYYFFAKATDILFFRFNKAYKELPREHQKNVTMYFMTIIFTAVALALQLVGSPGFHGEWHYWEIRCVRLAGVLTVALYLFELIFRFNMRLPLVAHHILTIFAISLGVTTMEYTQNPTFMLSGIIWLFQATTEQPTFVGLMGYRLKWKKETVAIILKVSAIQTFVFKAASATALLVYWALHQRFNYNSIDYVWSIFVWIIAIGLFLTQIWGSYVTYIIGVAVLKKKRPGPPIRLESGSSGSSSTDIEKGRESDFEPRSGTITPVEINVLGYDGKMVRGESYSMSMSKYSSSSALTAVDQ